MAMADHASRIEENVAMIDELVLRQEDQVQICNKSFHYIRNVVYRGVVQA